MHKTIRNNNIGPWIIFWTILMVSLIVRIYRLDAVPAGFFADEASIGYNAWSLLTTGKDEYGVPFPFFFRSFGDYRNPVPIYINIPAIALFGLSEFSVRLTSALAGTATVAITFFICLKSSIWKDRYLQWLFALSTMFFLAISPWHIHFSRFGSEYIYFPFLLSLSLLVFILSVSKPKLFPVSAILFGITLYTYYPTWMVTPLLVGTLVFLYRAELFKNKLYGYLFICIFLISFVPLGVGIQKGIALTRWKNVAISKETKVPLPLFFLKNFSKHFSPTFLFTKGDIDFPGHFINRFSSRGSAELYSSQIPLILIGVLFIISKRHKFHLSILALLLLYPLGSSLAATDGGAPLAFRSIIGVLPFQYISGLGIVILWDKIKSTNLKLIALCLIIITSVFLFNKYIQEYHNEYNNYSSDFWGWQFGARDVMGYFLEHQNEYDEFYLMGDFNSPEIFIKFYDPLNLCNWRCSVGGIERFRPETKQLFAIGIERLKLLPPGTILNSLKTIIYPSGSSAFLIGTL